MTKWTPILIVLGLVLLPSFGIAQSEDSADLRTFATNLLGASAGSLAGVVVDDISSEQFIPGDQERDLFPMPYGPTFTFGTTSGSVGGALAVSTLTHQKSKTGVWGSLIGAGVGLYVGSAIVDDVSHWGTGPSALAFSLIQGTFTAVGIEIERFLSD